VLFSEPKIPQFLRNVDVFIYSPCFSALQRAENSSIRFASVEDAEVASFSALQRAENSSMDAYAPLDFLIVEFQCSSASRKFLNQLEKAALLRVVCFSALQRAENSSINVSADAQFPALVFQCSSASRKFLNYYWLG